jgi:iron complex outermembrane receptor protein
MKGMQIENVFRTPWKDGFYQREVDFFSAARRKNLFLKVFFMLHKWFMAALMLLASNVAYSQATIIGRITGAEEATLEGANIWLKELKTGASTDQQGHFRIPDVPVGTYILEVSFIGYQQMTREVVVSAGQSEVTVEIQLQERSTTLEELIVKATRAGEKTPVAYQDLSKEKIQKANVGQDVPFLLRWTPSAVVTSDAGTGIGYTGIRIRGSDPTRINVTINGIPLNDSESQGVFWVNLPDFLTSASSVQIQRGVGTSTNGAGAFGASINLSTIETREEPYAIVGGSLGSFNTWKSNVQLGSGLLNDRFLISGRLSTIQSDGFIDRATADLNSYAVTAKYLGNSSSLQFNLFSGHEITYQAWYGVPADLLENPETRTFNPAGTEKEGEPHDDEVDNYRQTHYQLLYSNQLNSNWFLNLNAHYTKGMGFFEQYKADQALADYGIEPVLGEDIESSDLIRRLWLDNDFYGTVYSLNFVPDSKKIDLTIGGAFNIYEGLHFGEVTWARFAGNSEKDDRYYENDARKTDFNIYSKVNLALSDALNAFVDLQYRSVGYQFLGPTQNFDFIDQDVQLNFFNPKLGLTYSVNNQTDLYASFGVGQREPNRNDYVASTPNNRPRAEKLYDTEAGMRYRGRTLGLEVNAYFMSYTDQLALNGQLNQVGESVRVNIDQSYRLGLELAGAWAITSQLRLEGNATISRNRVERFVEFVDQYDQDFNYLGQEQVIHENTDLAFSPNLIAGGELTYQVFDNTAKNSLDISLLTKYVGQQYIDNTSDERNVIDPYSFSDIRLRYVWKPGWVKQVDLTFLARNIFDQQFETNAWSYRYIFDGSTTVDQGFFPQAGTNFLLGVNLHF